jgi:hypothetical protein
MFQIKYEMSIVSHANRQRLQCDPFASEEDLRGDLEFFLKQRKDRSEEVWEDIDQKIIESQLAALRNKLKQTELQHDYVAIQVRAHEQNMSLHQSIVADQADIEYTKKEFEKGLIFFALGNGKNVESVARRRLAQVDTKERVGEISSEVASVERRTIRKIEDLIVGVLDYGAAGYTQRVIDMRYFELQRELLSLKASQDRKRDQCMSLVKQIGELEAKSNVKENRKGIEKIIKVSEL